MTDPQPLSPQDIELVEMMLKDSGLVRSGPSIVAILRDYQRVLAENAGLKRHLEQRASGNDPLTVQLRGRVEELEAEVAALRGIRAANVEQTVKTMKGGFHAGCEACAQHVEDAAAGQLSPNTQRALKQLAENCRRIAKEATFTELPASAIDAARSGGEATP